jgi:hypothetical protein
MVNKNELLPVGSERKRNAMGDTIHRRFLRVSDVFASSKLPYNPITSTKPNRSWNIRY